MGPYLGDYAEDDTLDFIWDSNDSVGASITRATNGTISVYKANGTTQSVAGITDVEDFDGVVGIHHLRIVLTDAFYVTNADYNVVLSAATIDGQTVNAVLCSFSIENRFMRGTDGVDTATMRGTDSALLASSNGSGLTEAGGTGDHLTAIPWNASWDAEVESEVNDALVALNLDHLFAVAIVGGDVIDNSFAARITSKEATADYDDFVNTTDSLQAIRDYVLGPTVAGRTLDVSTLGTAGVDWGNVSDEAAVVNLVNTNTAVTAAVVNTQVDNALIDIGLDHLFSIAVVGTDITDNSFAARITSSSATADYDTFNNTDDSLQALRDRGDAAWITATGFSTITTAQVNAEVVDVMDTDTLVSGQTISESLRRIGAITSGKVTDAGTGIETFNDYAESASTIVITVDASGNRSAVTYN